MLRRIGAMRAAGASALAVLVSVAGPGLLAGLSDDDPAGVTTYSILGADFGYVLLWTIPLSTLLLIYFHILAIRLGVWTGNGFVAVVRQRWGPIAAGAAAVGFVVANVGTIAAEFAGVAAAGSLAGIPNAVSAAIAAVVAIVLILGASFHRIEHVLLVISSLLASYVVAAFLAHPDWGAAGAGLVTPTVPSTPGAGVAIAAVLGTTLAPWGLAFIQSYAVDKGLEPGKWRAERVEVIVGSMLTGVIGVFVAVTCAAVLHPKGVHIEDAKDAARALEPLAGQYASLLFGVGLVGAALLGAVLVPLATAYSIAEAVGEPADLDARFGADRVFQGSFVALVVVGAAIVSIPGIPLIPLIYASQLVNAIALPPLLLLLLVLNRDRRVVGSDHRLPALAVWIGAAALALVLASLALVALG